jgi:glycosyltransferase involved in cell wall biosynthesis
LSTSTKILTIIPAFNEGKTIAQVISGIKENTLHCDILVINDGSIDSTAERAKTAGAKVIHLPFNMGYGIALQTGYKYALEKGYHYMIQMDGDGQHDPHYIKDLLEVVTSGKADIAIGSRFSKNNKNYTYRAGWIKKVGIMLFASITSIIIRRKVSDPTSGYQAINRNVARFYASESYPCDYPDADVIIMLHRAGFHIKEFPVVMHRNRNKKSMHSGIKPLYYIFKMSLSIFLTLLRKREPLNQKN